MSPAPPAALEGRKLYVPRMTYCGSRAFSAALRSIGIDADVTPPSDERTLELGARFLSGDECFPAKITLGDFMKIMESVNYDTSRVAFFMPTADGPCRFGQYIWLMKKVMKEMGLRDEVIFVSPTSKNGYVELGAANATQFKRTAWRGLVAADILQKMLLKTRPYEIHKGETDRVFEECLTALCSVLEKVGLSYKTRLEMLQQSLTEARDRFRTIACEYRRGKPLIGVVGEIFCRLNDFSNQNLIRLVEAHGGEAWLSDMAEWVWYVESENKRFLRLDGKRISLDMLGAVIKTRIQGSDEHTLYEPFHEEFYGYEEPQDVTTMLNRTHRYLPQDGAMGEMALSVGKAVYIYDKGGDGIIDISPFTCMNGVTTEAVYPRVSRDCDDIPMKNFYFDGTHSDMDRDVGIFLELARTYQKRKKTSRVYPACFVD